MALVLIDNLHDQPCNVIFCVGYTSCFICHPGSFQELTGTSSCLDCFRDTYNINTGSTSQSDCRNCPCLSSTNGKTGQSSLNSCICSKQYYKTNGICKLCPKGALCANDYSCAFSNEDLKCKNGTQIVGNWTFANMSYVLTSCPPGYSIQSTEKTGSEDLQECFPCISSQYILDEDDECQTCPVGLKCSGNAQIQPVVDNSSWIQQGPIFILTSCPKGFSVLSKDSSGTFVSADQQCTPCPKGEECVSPPCVTCSPCRQGFYKPSVSTDSCTPCPANTYNTQYGAQDLSACQPCQSYASTDGRIAQTSQSACMCNNQYYEFASLSTITCIPCPQGATCSDGFCALRNSSTLFCPSGDIIVGSWRMDNVTGLYYLAACPPGYVLYSNQCQECPASFYCAEGLSTPCGSESFSLPGSVNITSCFPSVFVFVVINLPISRPFLSSNQILAFQNSLANLAGVNIAYVIIEVIQAGVNAATTDVTSKIATFDAAAAAVLSKRLLLQSSYTMGKNLISINSDFTDSVLASVEVTACVEGYELQAQPPPSTCTICLPDFYCSGGANGREPCPNDGFSYAGANSSSFCTQYAVSVLAILPVSKANFTALYQAGFINAVASAAGVSFMTVSLISLAETSNRRAASQSLQVVTQIVANAATDASSLSKKLDVLTLNNRLKAAGVPQCSLVSALVLSSTPFAPYASISSSVISGATIGCFAALFASCVVGYYFLTFLRQKWANQAFIAVLKCSNMGDPASKEYFPPSDEKDLKNGGLCLRTHFVAENVLGKGSSGYVLKAKRKNTEIPVAIKIIVPKNGTFDEAEKLQLQREGSLLRIVTARKCKFAVHLIDLPDSNVSKRADVCWFVMEALDGLTLHEIMRQSTSVVGNTHPGNAGEASWKSLSVKERETVCFQVARDVLAALKVVHSEGWLHRDVAPENIFRCSSQHWKGKSCEYKLIDFGSALPLYEAQEDGFAYTITATPYMAPELVRGECCVTVSSDLWSIGVTMFELAVFRLPFQFHTYQDSEIETVLKVQECFREGQLKAFDSRLAQVIAIALETQSNRSE